MSWFGKSKKSSSGAESDTATRLRESIRKILADGEAAEKIVSEYGGVLEITSAMTYGAPQSLLPRPKEEIKQALKNYLLFLHVTKTLDKKLLNMLQVGYASLAHFLNDVDAKVAVTGLADMNAITVAAAAARANPESADMEKISARMSSPNYSAALSRFAKSNEEFAALADEFGAIATNLGIKL